MKAPPVGLVGALAALLLASCSGHDAGAPGAAQITIKSPSLVKLKAGSEIPNCPEVSGTSVAGGMPAITLPCLGGGRNVDLAGLRGPMIVNIWAAWCGPCRHEMPVLAAYARSQSSVKVLGVDYSDPQAAGALELAKHSGVGYPLVADTQSVLDHASPIAHISGYPFSLFIDADGRLVHQQAGEFHSLAEVKSAAAQYLGVQG
jgi:thiol-disulfide isomerase/thioredoxin